MKLLVVTLFFGLTVAGPLDNSYLPPNSISLSGQPTGSIQAHHQQSPVYGPAVQTSALRNLGPDAHSNILRFDNNNEGTGNYQYQYETENKISQQEHGQLKQVGNEQVTVVQGSYSYVGDDGRAYTVNYVADENGFQPTGEHIDQAITKTAAEAAKFAAPELQQGFGQQSYHRGYSQQSNGGYQY